MNNHDEERDKLRKIQSIFENAVKNNSIEDIKPYTDKEFTFVSFSDRSFSDFESFSKQWNITRKEMVGNGSFSTQLDPQPSLFINDIAVTHGNSTNTMVDKKGNTFNFTSHWTVIFKLTNGEWKVLRAHNSLDPFNNPMLKHGVKSIVIKVGVIAFLLGGGICSLLSYLSLI